MKKMQQLMFVAILWPLIAGLTTPILAQVREVPRAGLGGIARVSQDRFGGHTIEYNPATCRRLGPACEFFRNHEYGHIRLDHLNRNISVRQAEYEADRYAAAISSPQAVAAAQQLFQQGRFGSFRHGTPNQRAARLDGLGNIPVAVRERARPPQQLSGSRGFQIPQRIFVFRTR